jgi:hypothetical protein
MNDTYLQLVKIRLQAAEINRRAELLGPSLVALGDRAAAALRDPVTVRLGVADDLGELERLAELDSAARPADPLLIGERAGQPIAALSLADGAIVANPFVASADVVALLRLRALQLRGRHPRRSRRRRLMIASRALRHGDL